MIGASGLTKQLSVFVLEKHEIFDLYIYLFSVLTKKFNPTAEKKLKQFSFSMLLSLFVKYNSKFF